MKKFFCFGKKDFCDDNTKCFRCDFCDSSGGEERECIETNADHIRSMTDEELAEFIPNWSYTDACKCGEHYVDCNNECEKCIAEWLEQPYKEEA